MGLDQYLYCNSKTVCKAVNDVMGDDRWHAVSGICAYWCKANQIHGWFVRNVQSGEDDCGIHDVSVGQLRELLVAVETVIASTRLVEAKSVMGHMLPNYRNSSHEKVLEDSSVAKELLPVQEGFFFGGTEYDEYYWDELERTKKVLDTIFASIHKVRYEMFEGYEVEDWMPVGETDWEVRFQYHSSW